MKRDGKYRFSLQFPAETEEQIRVGDLLERVGNRKSSIVVEAVSAYIRSHPELMTDRGKVTIRMEGGYSREQIEILIRKILEERLAGTSPPTESAAIDTSSLDDDISQMLDNLNFFN